MTIARVGGQGGGVTGSGATISRAFPSNVAAGSLISVVAWKYSPAATAYSAGNCTQSAGTATLGAITLDRQVALAYDGGTDYLHVAVWSAIVATPGSLTMQVAGNAGDFSCLASDEFSGVWDAARLEASNGGSNATDGQTAASSGNASAVGAALFIGGLSVGNSGGTIAVTPDAAFTTIFENEAGATTQVGSAVFQIAGAGLTDAAEWTIGSSGNLGWGAVVAVYKEAGPPPQVARPTSDTTAGAWTPTPGAPTTLFDKIDEAAADDGDYISATGNTVGAVALSSLSTPEAGTQTLRVRAQGSPTKRLIARLLEGASTRATITVDPLGALATATAVAAGIVSYAALAVELEVQDATSPPAATVTWGAVGTAASGTTSCTPAYPTGISAATSKIFCLVTGRSSTASTAFTMPAGWTSVAQLEGGTGTWGVDTGTRRVGLFQKDTTVGTETGTVTVSLAGDTNNTLRASIFRVEVPSGFGISVEAGTGADTTNATSFSATSSTSISLAPDDLLIIGVAQNIDSGTQSAQSITAAGITFGTRSNRASTAVTNGNDHRHIMDSVPVTAGTATVAPTYAYTISASGSGPALFARLRATAPTEAARVTWVEFEVPTAASSGGGGKAPMRARRLPLRRLIQH